MTDPQYSQYPGYQTQPPRPGHYPPQYPGYPQPHHDPRYPMPQPPQAPPNHLAIAIVGLIFFWPVGLAAVLNAAKVDSLYTMGQWNAAYMYSDRAKRCSIWAISVGAVLSAIYLAMSILVEFVPR